MEKQYFFISVLIAAGFFRLLLRRRGPQLPRGQKNFLAVLYAVTAVLYLVMSVGGAALVGMLNDPALVCLLAAVVLTLAFEGRVKAENRRKRKQA
ncbi:MAG: hypothetical protein P8018_05965, partial [Acidobacteriota bacterium]